MDYHGQAQRVGERQLPRDAPLTGFIRIGVVIVQTYFPYRHALAAICKRGYFFKVAFAVGFKLGRVKADGIVTARVLFRKTFIEPARV